MTHFSAISAKCLIMSEFCAATLFARLTFSFADSFWFSKSFSSLKFPPETSKGIKCYIGLFII